MANTRGMGSVAWGQRKALRGMPYGTDPAYLLAQQQLQEEYNMLPERARLSEQKRQFALQQEEADKNRKAQGMSGIMGAGTQVLTADALGGFKGTRGLIGYGTEGYNAITGATSMPYAEAQAIADAGGTIATGSIAPAEVDMAATETAMNAGVGAPTGMSGAELGTETGTASTGGSMAGAGMAAAAAASVIAGHKAGNERGGALGLTQGTPFSLATAPQSLLADKAFGDSNYFTKNLNAMQRQEKGFYDGLDSLLSGDIGGWASGTANAVLAPITSILGIDDIF